MIQSLAHDSSASENPQMIELDREVIVAGRACRDFFRSWAFFRFLSATCPIAACETKMIVQGCHRGRKSVRN
jgi:hypothetical protein